MLTIHLKNLRFTAFHGVYAEEAVLGNEFEVNIAVDIENPGRVAALEDTIDYGAVFAIAKQRMQQPTGLLETVAQDIAAGILATDSRVSKVQVSIDKLNTPIGGFTGSAGVSCTAQQQK